MVRPSFARQARRSRKASRQWKFRSQTRTRSERGGAAARSGHTNGAPAASSSTDSSSMLFVPSHLLISALKALALSTNDEGSRIACDGDMRAGARAARAECRRWRPACRPATATSRLVVAAGSCRLAGHRSRASGRGGDHRRRVGQLGVSSAPEGTQVDAAAMGRRLAPTGSAGSPLSVDGWADIRRRLRTAKSRR